MNLKAVEIVMSPDELLRALWYGERTDSQIAFGLTGTPDDWKVNSLYYSQREGQADVVTLTIVRKEQSGT